ncbi:MAG: protein-L-isoaspartate(D-aspartate) O-methyltransferase [Flavobacteriales bacterium]|jgi:protein-L-isoaspartate(D-aspartate) O-methyltransferase|nr:MAG: protein-L-isoaspartate(D-aspartate) O-methyltransferase [Flavobacteriales bacterium]RPF73438.1 MAG: protein-L-isoaspartate(D-aspartate) O-methyltransferase [Thiotrichales bacterium TMED285]|tara:strand:- start:2201 stop:2845 length:645 start_codon:yes stop_codon:yes gene_type:complete
MKQDTTKHQGKRRQLIAVLKQKGITQAAVLNAIGDIPRHLFLDSSFVDHAYQDKAFPIGADQTISQPYTVAFQSEQLQLKTGMKVLEIGTGSGYQTAVLCHMGAEVYSIERQHELFRTSLKRLPSLGYKPKKLIFGDGYKGFPKKAPFDRILVTAGAPSVPEPLLAQLAVGGKMVIPVGDTNQKMTVISRTSDTNFQKLVLGDFRFVPLLEDKN